MKAKGKLWLTAGMFALGTGIVAAQGPPMERPSKIDEHGRRPGWEEGHRHHMRERMRMGHRLGFGGLMARRGRGVLSPQMRERLGITPEQAAKMQAQASEVTKSSIRARAELRIKRMELLDLMRAEIPDRTAIDKKMREINEAQFAQQRSRMDALFAFRDSLTPEQRERMKQMLEERRGPRMRHDFPPARAPRGPGRPPAPPSPPDAPGI